MFSPIQSPLPSSSIMHIMHIIAYHIIWYHSTSYGFVLKYHGVPNIHMDYHHFPYQNCHLNIIPTFSNTPNVESPPLTGGPFVPPTSPPWGEASAALFSTWNSASLDRECSTTQATKRMGSSMGIPLATTWGSTNGVPSEKVNCQVPGEKVGVVGSAAGIPWVWDPKESTILTSSMRLVSDCQWNKTHWHSWRPELTW